MCMLDKIVEIGELLDFYGALLTEKQQRSLELHFMCDLSLSEIADELGVSRQAVYDMIHRSEQVLAEYEQKLGLISRRRQEREALQEILRILEADHSGNCVTAAAREKLSELLGNDRREQSDL